MPFSLEQGISIITVFFQGIISFFSPCTLPLIPLYISIWQEEANTPAAMEK